MKLAENIANAVAAYYRPSGVPKHYADNAVAQHVTSLIPLIESQLKAAINEYEIGKRILRHAADYLYVEHGVAKSKQIPNCITFYDRAAEVLGLAMQELRFAIVRINVQEH